MSKVTQLWSVEVRLEENPTSGLEVVFEDVIKDSYP
jgi:hypothetical protein